jgi:hypothetical protein
MTIEDGTSEIEACLYRMRQHYLAQISAGREAGVYTAEFDQSVRQIEKINFVLRRLAKRNLSRNWPSELDFYSAI